MKPTPFLRGVILAATLLVFPDAHAASRAAASSATASTEAITSSSSDPTTTKEHLDAAQKAVDEAAGQLQTAITSNRGGFVEKAKEDINQVLADLKEANAYIAAHPDLASLQSGPAPAESSDLHPETFSHLGTYRGLNSAIADLNDAVKPLVNNPGANYHGPVLGGLGGIRGKIIMDIVKTAADILAAENYAESNPSARKNAAPAPAPVPAKPAPVANKALSPDQLRALVLVEGDYARGTGFVAKIHEQFFIVTNLHVLSGNKKFTITGMDGEKYPTTGPLYGAADRDIAILKIPPELAKNYFEFQDDPFTNALAGDAVTVPGNSAGAGVPIQINGKVLGIGPELVEVDAKFVEGNSGSPIIHLPSGKVIGVATFAITYKLDDLNKAAKTQDIRWFGLRLDNIDPKQWEALDWKRFSDESLKMRDLENLTSIMVALLRDQKLPPTSNDQVVAAIATYQTNATLATKRKSERDVLGAIQSFMQTLVDLSKSDIRNLSDQKLYSYDANRLKQQQDLLVIIDKAFATASKQISSFKNSL